MADPAVESIARFVRPPYLTVDADDSARVAYRRMQADNVRTLAVVKNGQYVGVVDWRTISELAGDEMSRPVADFARRDLPTLTVDTSIADAMAKFAATDVAVLGLLPVVDSSGRLEGVVERDEFQGLMEGESGQITVPEDPVAHLVEGPDVPRPGARVVSSDGKKLGTFVRHVEDRGWPRWMLVKHGFFKKKYRRVPLIAVEHQSRDRVVLNIDQAMWKTFQDRPSRE